MRIAITVAALAICSFSCLAEDTGLNVKFVARGSQIADPNAPTSFTGHAYIIMAVKTNTGIKEEIFGFYPTTSGRGLIKGPGMLKAEYRCGPSDDCGPEMKQKLLAQLSKSEQTVTVDITENQRRQIYKEINRWDSKSTIGADDRQIVPSSDQQYRLADHNCIDFVASVVGAIGYTPPERGGLQTPTQFLKQLAVSVDHQDKLRAAERAKKKSDELAKAAQEKARQSELEAKAANDRASDAEGRAVDAEARARQATDNARQAEQRRQAIEQESIPAGWVPCTCPQKHGGSGKCVRGVLYHPADIRC